MIFVAYKSGTGGNFVAALINKMLGSIDSIIISENGNSHLSQLPIKPTGKFGNEVIDLLKHIKRNDVAVGVETANIEYILEQVPDSKIVVISFEKKDLTQIKFNLFCKLHVDDYHRMDGKLAWMSFIEEKPKLSKNVVPWENDFSNIQQFCEDELADCDDGKGKVCTTSFKFDSKDDRVINIEFSKLINGDKSIITDLINFLNIVPANSVDNDLEEYYNKQPIYSEETYNRIKAIKNEII